MPPEKVEMLESFSSNGLPDRLPLLVTPPANVTILVADTAVMPPAMVPELAMPPLNVAIVPDDRPTAMTGPETPPVEMVPALEMPPRNVTPVPWIAGVAFVVIRLAPSTRMRPAIMPLSTMWPVIVPLAKVMPPGEIVPSLVMLPVKLVLTMATQGVVAAAGLSKVAWIVLAHAAKN